MNFQLKVPPPVYALICVTSMWLLSLYYPAEVFISEKTSWYGIVIVVIAVGIDFWSLVLFLKKRTTPNPMRPEFTTGLVTEGFYRFSRNPMYLGLLLMLFGFAIFLRSFTPFFVLPMFFILITEMQIKPEEEILKVKFGQEYLEYQKKVRRWI